MIVERRPGASDQSAGLGRIDHGGVCAAAGAYQGQALTPMRVW